MVNWGDVPTWLAGIFAAVAAVFAWRALRLERKRDRLDENRLTRSQADKIALTITPQKSGEQLITVWNRSDAPVTDTRVAGISRTGRSDILAVFHIIPPGEHREILVPDAPAHVRCIEVLHFKDMHGAAWKRYDDGTLQPDPNDQLRSMLVEYREQLETAGYWGPKPIPDTLPPLDFYGPPMT